jgi:hypothetical protein
MKKILLFASLALTINAFAQNCVIADYRFNGDANDISGNGNHGVVNGATLTTDRFGNPNSAYSFNGTSDYIDLPNGTNTNLNVIGEIGISFWIKTGLSSATTIISCGDNVTAGGDGYLISSSLPPSPSTIAYHSTSWDYGTTVINDNIWHNIIITENADALWIFVDGMLDITNTIVSFPTSWAGARRIGVASNMANYFNGQIDDVKIYNCALDSTQIDSIYQAESSLCTVYDTVMVYDTTFVTIYDTVMVYDTTFVTVQDTNFVTDTTLITVTDTLIIDVILGIAPPNDLNTLKVFPNPAFDHITIDNGNFANMAGYSIEITNAIGQTVFQSQITQQQFYVDLSGWTGNGTYFIKIIDPSLTLIDTRKIILQ